MDAWAIAGIVLGGLVGIYLLMSALMAVVGVAFSHPQKRFVPAEAPHGHWWAEECHAWAEEHGFRWHGAYRSVGPSIAAWVLEDEPTCLCLYYVVSHLRSTEFRTELSGERSLTTSSNRNSVGDPRPAGTWVQAFTGRTLDQRWDLHRQGVEYLRNRVGIEFARERRDFLELLVDGMRQELGYIRSLPLWPLRWPYWYFVRRRRLVNKTVREQIEFRLLD